MGLNEYAVLNQVWQGNIHAPQIAEATNFHPQLVKACLISLERAQILEYSDGYKPFTAKIKRERQKRVNKKYDRPIMDILIDFLKANPGSSNKQIAKGTTISESNVRAQLARGQRSCKITSRKVGRGCDKIYFLMGEI